MFLEKFFIEIVYKNQYSGENIGILLYFAKKVEFYHSFRTMKESFQNASSEPFYDIPFSLFFPLFPPPSDPRLDRF
jgi:hypothetical protein